MQEPPSGIRAFAFLAVFCCLAMAGRHAVSGEEKPLTNEDVIQLGQAGLPDSVIVAKIKQTGKVALNVEADTLVALGRAGVSPAVLQAMIERMTPPSPTPPPSAPAVSVIDAYTQAVQAMMQGGDESIKVRLVEGTNEQPLRLARGEMHFRGFLGAGNTFMDYPGLRARVRCDGPTPHLLVQSTTPVQGGRYFLVKLEKDKDDGVRSLKVSSVKGRFKALFKPEKFMEPDHDWVVPFEVSEAGTDLWKITPRGQMRPGEYAFYVYSAGMETGFGAAMQSGGIFDFGVDGK